MAVSPASLPTTVARTLLTLLFAASLAPACSTSDDGTAPAQDTAAGDVFGDSGGTVDAGMDAGNDGGADADNDAGDDAGGPDWPDPDDFTWPSAPQPGLIAGSKWGKHQLVFRNDPFVATNPGELGMVQPRWVKFSVLVGDPTKVWWQHSGKYPLHYDYISAHLTPWKGKTPVELDAVSLREAGQELILGAVLFAPAQGVLEWGMQLVRQDAYHPEVVRRVFELVKGAIQPEKPGQKLHGLYFPTFEQEASAQHFATWLAGKGVEVSSPARWGSGACYATGWAMGRVVRVAGAAIHDAWQQGKLTDTDILLTDAVPAEIPPVAGVLVEKPSTPNSHVAQLARDLGTPFAWLGEPAQVAAADALVGQTALLRVRERSVWDGGCDVWLHDATQLQAATKDTLTKLKAPAKLSYQPKQTVGAVSVDLADKTLADAKTLPARVGGKASGFVLLRDAIPNNSPDALALSFDLWDRFMAQKADGSTLGAVIAGKLAGLSWPVPPKTLSTTAAEIRELVLGGSFAEADRKQVLDALSAKGFVATHKLRFRSSTNVEDSAHFTGAGLYDSYSGCLADDLDADSAGPSKCDPSKKGERGVLRAIRKVYASFYNEGALRARLRHGVDESQVGMAIVVHHSFPDEDELANGVGTLEHTGNGFDPVDLVTQKGAVSVTNPSTTALPELVRTSVGSNYPSLHTPSTLVPLGATVLEMPADYVQLSKLFGEVLTSYGKAFSGTKGVWLDFEYKKIAPGHPAQPKPATAPWLVVKQVRRLPAPGGGQSSPPLLVGDTVRRCTFQGESGDVFGVHRTKARWQLTARQGAAGGSSLFAKIKLELVVDGAVKTIEGAPTSLPDYTHTTTDASGYQPPQVWHTDRFSVTTQAGKQTWELRVRLPKQADMGAGPMVVLGDTGWQNLEVRVTHPKKMPKISWQPGVTWVTEDFGRLGVCPDDVVEGPEHQTVVRKLAGKLKVDGKDVSWSFEAPVLWPPSPKGPTAGYTAPLLAWKGPAVLTGLTTKPLSLSGWFSRSHRPEHHNFGDFMLLEPALEPGLPAATKAELDALGVRWIVLHGEQSGAKATLLAADGTVVAPAK